MLLSFLASCNRLISKGTTAKNPRGGKGGGTTTQPAPTGGEAPLAKQAGVKRYYLNINGDNRTFLVQLPAGYNASKTYPVVFAFHSIRGKDTSWLKGRNIGEYVDKNQYIGVYAQGFNGGIWNIGGNYPFKKVSEPDFVKGMYAWLKQNTKIDEKRVYAIGTSNGALLAHYLAVETNIFAAIAPISGSLYVDEMKPTAQPISILQIHGMVDKTVPYEGGYNPWDYTFLSAQNSMKAWAKTDGCSAEPTVTNLLNNKVQVSTYNSCGNGKQLILYSLPNVPHKVLQSFDADWIFNQIFGFFAKNTK